MPSSASPRTGKRGLPCCSGRRPGASTASGRSRGTWRLWRGPPAGLEGVSRRGCSGGWWVFGRVFAALLQCAKKLHLCPHPRASCARPDGVRRPASGAHAHALVVTPTPGLSTAWAEDGARAGGRPLTTRRRGHQRAEPKAQVAAWRRGMSSFAQAGAL